MAGRAGSAGPAAPWAEARLVGRDDVLDELHTAAAEAAGGFGRVILLTGEAGIGKTSVARALAAQARQHLATTWGTCAVDRSAPPFWPWRTLLPDDEPSAPAPSAAPSDPAIGAERFRRLNELRDRIVAGASRRPALHVIEDLQWADVSSVLLLAHLGTTIGEHPLLVVATVRSGEALTRPLGDAIEDVRRAAAVHELRPLDDSDIAALVHAAGLPQDPEATTVLRERTGGNPLFITELLRTARAAAVDGGRREVFARSVPGRISELVDRRLARLPPPVAELLASAAVIGVEGEARLLAGATGASLDSVLDLADQARAAHLLDLPTPGRWRFRHQLIRDAVYGGIAATSLARHHVAVLEALAAGDDEGVLPVVAHHALAAQPLFDADRAVALAARAGESSFAQHAYEEAVSWFERALAAAPSGTAPRWKAELLVLRGEAQRHMGEIAAARASFVAAASLTEDDELIARAALGYADPGADLGIAYRSDDPTTGELLARAIRAQATGDSVTRVELEARFAAFLYFSDEPGRARELAAIALERARRIGDERALVAAAAVHHDAFVLGQAPLDVQLTGSEDLLARARASRSPSALLTAHRARVFDLLSAGDLTGMDVEILAFSRLAEPLGVPGYSWWPALWSAMRALLEGRHAAAEEQALATFDIGAAPFPSLAFTNLSFLLFFLRREQGRLEEMEQATRDYAASHADIPAIRVALMFLLAEIGRADEARGLLTSIDDAELDRLRDRNWPAAWFQLARAAYLVGERDVAAKLLDDRRRPTERCVGVSLATVCLGAADLATAWLFDTVGELDAAAERYRRAEVVNARIGARSWLAQTRVDHARLLLCRDAEGDRDAARDLHRLVAEAVDAFGLGSLRRATDEIGLRLGGAAPSASASSAPARATFRRVGAVWELVYAGRSASIPDARGLRDLAFLLARPGEAVSVLELADDPSVASGDRGPAALDERARREIRRRLRELDEEEADAEANGEAARAALARDRRQELAETVARDFGLGGRPRMLGDPVERTRKTVSTRVRRTIAQVGVVHPELGRHLERSVDTGAWCAYRPAEPIAWQT